MQGLGWHVSTVQSGDILWGQVITVKTLSRPQEEEKEGNIYSFTLHASGLMATAKNRERRNSVDKIPSEVIWFLKLLRVPTGTKRRCVFWLLRVPIGEGRSWSFKSCWCREMLKQPMLVHNIDCNKGDKQTQLLCLSPQQHFSVSARQKFTVQLEPFMHT